MGRAASCFAGRFGPYFSEGKARSSMRSRRGRLGHEDIPRRFPKHARGTAHDFRAHGSFERYLIPNLKQIQTIELCEVLEDLSAGACTATISTLAEK